MLWFGEKVRILKAQTLIDRRTVYIIQLKKKVQFNKRVQSVFSDGVIYDNLAQALDWARTHSELGD